VYQPLDGKIYLKGKFGEIEIDNSTRSLFSFVPQGNLIFSGSIRDNLLFTGSNATDDEIYDALKKAGFRVSLDARNEKLGYKLRESVIKKIPYMLILGQKEVDEKLVSYRRAGSEETTTLKLEEFIELINNDIKNKVRYDK
jgi:histidyl-tRNA synthetase